MTVRIDTIRRDIAAAIDMLEKTSAELDTLHDMAYTRPSRTDLERVRGGMPDYSLDRYGDPEARHALQVISAHVLKACRTIEDGTTMALRSIRDRRPEADNTITRTQIQVQEYLELLEAVEKRRARGEYAPHMVHPQPMLRGVEAKLKEDNKALQKKVAKLQRQLRKAEKAAEQPIGASETTASGNE